MATFTFPPRTAATKVDPAILAAENSIRADVFNLQGLAAQNEANARASEIEAEGYQRQIEAYGTVGAIAKQNATIEGISGNIKQLQAGRAVQRTVGRQRAETAAAGFSDAGSSLDIMKATLQEGYLQDQIIRSQTSITQGGFLEQSAAADADAEGARLASDAAMELSRGYTSAGQLATANAAEMLAALEGGMGGVGGDGFSSRGGMISADWGATVADAIRQRSVAKIGPAGWGSGGLDIEAHRKNIDNEIAALGF